MKCKWPKEEEEGRQLYSVVNSAQSDEKRLITVNVHEECYFFDFLHRLIFVICLKCLPSAHMRVLSRECHWSMDASVVHCSMKGMINATNKILH